LTKPLRRDTVTVSTQGVHCFVAIALLVALSAACQPTAEDEAPLELGATSLGIALDESGDAPVADAVLTISIVNRTDDALTITSLTPVADPGLRVEYLGYSSCRRGCPGAVLWNEETEQLVRQGVEGRLPLRVDPSPSLSLEFRLGVDPSGLERFKTGCLRMTAAQAQLDDGRVLTVTNASTGWAAAIQLAEPRPSGYNDCEL
jgi:hypothetical protein